MRLFGRKAVARAIVGMIPVAAAVVLMAESNLTLRLRDDCDPATFNATIGPGTCVGGGDTTFQEFINEFNKNHSVGAWKMDPDEANTDKGTVVNVRNRGGEAHTFTQVAKFGGGFVGLLNTFAGAPAPECGMTLPNGTIVPAGTALGSLVQPNGMAMTTLTAKGTYKFQCCIHPWMHSVITVK